MSLPEDGEPHNPIPSTQRHVTGGLRGRICRNNRNSYSTDVTHSQRNCTVPIRQSYLQRGTLAVREVGYVETTETYTVQNCHRLPKELHCSHKTIISTQRHTGCQRGRIYRNNRNLYCTELSQTPEGIALFP